jgi:predicted RNase H-like nuclease (RuvC/YqgF family)
MFGLLRAKKDLQKYMDLHDSDIKVISQLTTRNHELQAIIEHLQAELDYHKAKLETIKGELQNERHTTSSTNGERDSGKAYTVAKRAKRNL